jgi:hypothetical protein
MLSGVLAGLCGDRAEVEGAVEMPEMSHGGVDSFSSARSAPSLCCLPPRRRERFARVTGVQAPKLADRAGSDIIKPRGS